MDGVCDDGTVWDHGDGSVPGSYRERMGGDSLVSGVPVADIGIGWSDAAVLWADAVGGSHGSWGVRCDDWRIVGMVSDSLMSVAEGSSRLLGADARLLGMVDGARMLALMRYHSQAAVFPWSRGSAECVAAVLAGSGAVLPVRDAALAAGDLLGWGGVGSGAVPDPRSVIDRACVGGMPPHGAAAWLAGLWMRVRRCGVPWSLLGSSGTALGVALDPYAVGDAGDDGFPLSLARLADAWEADPSDGDWDRAAGLAGMAPGVGSGVWASRLPGVAEGDDPGTRRALLSVMVASGAGLSDPAGSARSMAGLPLGFVRETVGCLDGGGRGGVGAEVAARVLSGVGGPVGGVRVLDGAGPDVCGHAAMMWCSIARVRSVPWVPGPGSWLPFWSGFMAPGGWDRDGARLVPARPPRVLAGAVDSAPGWGTLSGLAARIAGRL